MMTLAEARLVEKIQGAPWDIDAYIRVGGYEAWKKCVNELTPEQINSAMRKHLDPARISVIKAGDFKKPSPVRTPALQRRQIGAVSRGFSRAPT